MILLDTNVVSEVMKVSPTDVVLHWLNQQESSSLYVSTITIGEIGDGLRILPDGKRRSGLNDKFEQFIAMAFAQRVIAYDEPAARIYGEIMGVHKESGRPMSWFKDPRRATHDLDLLGFGDPSPDAMLSTFREILAQDASDGVVFDVNALRVDRIREELEYGGLRLRTTASISGARIKLTIDIGFGDVLVPGVQRIDYLSLRLRAYARETMIAQH